MRLSPRFALLTGSFVALSLIGGCAVSTVGEASASAIPATASSSATPTIAATEPASPLTGRTIVIDPGHTGAWTSKWGYRKVSDGNGRKKACNSSGTATNRGYSEHAYNMAQAKELAKELRALGATVLLTRTDDNTRSINLCVNHRADLLNTTPADLLISLHADGNLGKGHRGFHIIVSQAMRGGKSVIAKSKTLAKDLRAALEQGTPMPRSNYTGKGTAYSFRSDLGTLNFAKYPAVMIEMGNMRNATDAKLFTSAAYRTKAAQAITAGVVAYLS
jgi:N-acetylmuramoyl-L-alanine amidase